MAEVNSLILNVKSDGVLKAAKELDRLSKESRGVDKATDVLLSSNKKLQRSYSDLGKKLSVSERELKQLGSQYDKTRRLNDSLGKQLSDTNKKLDQQRLKSSLLFKQFKRQKAETAELRSELKKMEGQLQRNNNAVGSLGGGFGRLIPLIATAAASIAGVRFGIDVVRTTADLETLETSFIALAGGAQEAKDQIQILRNFSATTPFQFEGVAQASRQLITAKGNAKGLTDELRIIGDIAAASGGQLEEIASIYTKILNSGRLQAEELNQLSDRGIPIYQQLAKQLNTTAEGVRKLGEQGKLSFKDLQQAFREFGQEGGFAFEATERQSQTLNGQISTLKDNVNELKIAIGQLFETDSIKSGVGFLTDSVRDITTFLQNNKQRGDARAIALLSEEKALEKVIEKRNQLLKIREAQEAGRLTKAGVGEDIAELNKLNEILEKAKKEQANYLKIAENNVLIREKTQIAIGAREFVTKEQSDALFEEVAALSRRNKAIQGTIDKEKELDALRQKFKTGDFSKEFLKIQNQVATEQEKADASFQRSAKVLEEYKNGLIKLYEGNEIPYDEFKKATAEVETTLERLAAITFPEALTEDTDPIFRDFKKIEDTLRTQTEILEDQYSDRVDAIQIFKSNLEETGNLTVELETRINNTLTRIGEDFRAARDQFENDYFGQRYAESLPQESDAIPEPTAPRRRRRSSGGGVRRQSEFDKLKESLRNEEKLVEQSYIRRLELIRNNTKAGSDIRKELELSLAKQVAIETTDQIQAFQSSLDGQAYQNQLDNLRDFYAKRREIIVNSSILTEQEKNDKIIQLDREQAGARQAIERERIETTISGAQDFFADLSSIQETFGKRGAKVAKAAAIASVTIDTARNAVLAYQRGLEIPFGGGPILGAAFAAAAIAAGAAQAAQIKAQSVGNFTNGGIVGGNSYSGDRLTANVNSAEMILNTSQQRQLFDMANGRGNGGNAPNVTIINQTSQQVEGEARQDEQGNMEIIIREAVKRTKSDLTTEANRGGQAGGFVSTLANNYGLTRKGA